MFILSKEKVYSNGHKTILFSVFLKAFSRLIASPSRTVAIKGGGRGFSFAKKNKDIAVLSSLWGRARAHVWDQGISVLDNERRGNVAGRVVFRGGLEFESSDKIVQVFGGSLVSAGWGVWVCNGERKGGGIDRGRSCGRWVGASGQNGRLGLTLGIKGDMEIGKFLSFRDFESISHSNFKVIAV